MSEITTSELLEHCASCIDDAEDIELIMAHDAAQRAKLASYETAGDIYQAYTDLRAKLVASEAAAYDVANTIQALKDKLAHVEQYLETQRQATYKAVAREHEAKLRVAELEQERDDLKYRLQAWNDAHAEAATITEADVTWAQDSLTQLDLMRQQLADKDAEIAALQHQLSQLLFFTPGGGQ